MNNSNPFTKAYFKEQSKKYIAIAKKSFKKIEKEYAKMYSNDGTPNDKYNDDTMCSYYDMEKFLEFIDDKESFYSCGSPIVDLINLDNDIERYRQLIIKVTEKINNCKKEKKDILVSQLKVE
tara:strand:+ start:121 stop:486 length:366 start_codon:yes stop_codon:yes gene_type:complete